MTIINNDLKNTYKSFIDELLRVNSLSLPCKVLYSGSLFTECSNCYIDPISGSSSNRYKAGGAFVFAAGQICPNCRGLGGTHGESYDLLNMLVIFDYKYWTNFNSKIHPPEGQVQTISPFSDYTKINSCNKIIIDTTIQDYTESYYTRNSEPQPAGFGESSYIFTMWKKI